MATNEAMKRSIFEDDEDSEEDIVPKKPKKLLIPTEKSDAEVLSTEECAKNDAKTEDSLDYMDFDTRETKLESKPQAKSERTLLDDKTSIGLSIMQKMGFKVGESLGKNTKKDPGVIKVVQKSDKSGIGKETQLERVDDFITYKVQNNKEKTELKLKVSLMKTCFELSGDAERWEQDKNADGINSLWKEYAILLLDKEEDRKDRKRIISGKNSTTKCNNSISPLCTNEHIQLLIEYLRISHLYCYFCGSKFTDRNDLDSNCPGPAEEDHAEY